MEAFWQDMLQRRKSNTLKADEKELFTRFGKAISNLSLNPKHPGLRTHEIEPLSKKYGMKIWQSYLDQGKTARRFFWAYGIKSQRNYHIRHRTSPGRQEARVIQSDYTIRFAGRVIN
ncbi:MAG: hypothetical protein ABR545_00400 [Cyclonatronaceae bacterium]